MFRKSVKRFSEKIMPEQKAEARIRVLDPFWRPQGLPGKDRGFFEDVAAL
jgi:hypothetical protein